jgi:hypothetical protein
MDRDSMNENMMDITIILPLKTSEENIDETDNHHDHRQMDNYSFRRSVNHNGKRIESNKEKRLVLSIH